MIYLMKDKTSKLLLGIENKLKTIRKISFQTDFYWKGDRYKQFLRSKDKKSKSKVMCYKLYDPYGGYFYMPLNRKVKPVYMYQHNNLNY